MPWPRWVYPQSAQGTQRNAWAAMGFAAEAQGAEEYHRKHKDAVNDE